MITRRAELSIVLEALRVTPTDGFFQHSRPELLRILASDGLVPQVTSEWVEETEDGRDVLN